MVNSRLLAGRNLTRHPLAENEVEGVYVRGAPFMAIQADQGGRIDTPDGVKTFHAGDWICTDIPPTYAWIMDQQTFQVAGFSKVGSMNPDRMIAFPIAEGDKALDHDTYEEMLKPPANASEALAQVPELGMGGSTDVAASQAVENATTVIVEEGTSLSTPIPVTADQSARNEELMGAAKATGEAMANAAAADPISTPAPSPTVATPSPDVPRAPGPGAHTKATLPAGKPASPPKAKTGPKK